MVHQEFMLVSELTVLENIILGFEPRKGCTIDFDKAKNTVQHYIDPVSYTHLDVYKRQLYALCKLTEKQADIDFKNLSASLPDLKQYLEVREQNEMYESVRRAGGIGIPYFELEDGTGTLDLNEVMARI